MLKQDRLDYMSRNELALIYRLQKKNSKAERILKELDNIMQDRVQSYLEFSTVYAGCGYFDEAREVLERLEVKGNSYPMLYYYLGYYCSRLDDIKQSSDYYDKARSMPHDYCFPFRDESVTVLNAALQYNPADAMALYYLGNLYYEQQPEKAVALWEESRRLDNTFYIVQRNLALAAREQAHDPAKAAVLYGEAFANNREDARLMYEYDLVLAGSGEQPAVRYDRIFRNNRHVSSQHSSTFLREIELLIFLGKYDEVDQIISTTQFVESEGSRTFRDVFHNTYVLKSLQNYASGNLEAALADIQKALDFPIGRWGSERRAQMYYLKGLYAEKQGKADEARVAYEKAVSELVEGTEYYYEKGLAYQKLGETAKAKEQFAALQALANRRGDSDAFRSFEAGSAGGAQWAQNLYMRGLVHLGMNQKGEAEKQFAEALKQYPAHVWANYRLTH
jgi:tetratricopeptide (TPR) repeat protein